MCVPIFKPLMLESKLTMFANRSIDFLFNFAKKTAVLRMPILHDTSVRVCVPYLTQIRKQNISLRYFDANLCCLQTHLNLRYKGNYFENKVLIVLKI